MILEGSLIPRREHAMKHNLTKGAICTASKYCFQHDGNKEGVTLLIDNTHYTFWEDGSIQIYPEVLFAYVCIPQYLEKAISHAIAWVGKKAA